METDDSPFGISPRAAVRRLGDFGQVPVLEVGPAQEAVLRIGDVGRFDTAEAREVRAVGEEPAIVLLVRVADRSWR